MPFPKPPRLDLRQWDEYACDAAVVAQILYMGGKLRYPFDTARFDQRLGREPGQPIVSAEGARLVTSLLPVTVRCFSPVDLSSLLDPTKARKSLQGFGYSPSEIAAYFSGPQFKLSQKATRDFMKLDRELGKRYKRRICHDSSKYVGSYLQRGALVVASELDRDEGSPTAHSVLLIPRSVKRGKVSLTLFDPTLGPEETTLDRLIADGQVRLDDCGFTAYML